MNAEPSGEKHPNATRVGEFDQVTESQRTNKTIDIKTNFNYWLCKVVVLVVISLLYSFKVQMN